MVKSSVLSQTKATEREAVRAKTEWRDKGGPQPSSDTLCKAKSGSPTSPDQVTILALSTVSSRRALILRPSSTACLPFSCPAML